MGDCNVVAPMEGNKEEEVDIEADDDVSKCNDSQYSNMYKPNNIQEGKHSDFALDDDKVDVINGQLIDIHKYRFNDRFQNLLYSTNPLIPRYHTTFGEPLDRQELSVDHQN